MTNAWVIAGPDDGETLYWSNHFGWCDLGDADRFTDSEREAFNLPDGGKWMRERIAARAKAPYGEMCRDPNICAGKGYCPRDPTCGD